MSRFPALLLFVFATVLGLSGHAPAAQDAAAKVFRAGAATSNVTPWLGVSVNGGMTDRRATHVHDELHARCLVLDDGTTKLAFVVVDSCALPKEGIDAAKQIIAERTQIPATHVMISATHTHEAPTAVSVFQSDPDPEYLRYLPVKIADGVQRAANNLAPAQIGWAVAQAPGQVNNRRWRMKPGVAIPPDPFGGTTDQVRMNPTPGSPELLEPAGPIDPEVWVLAARAKDGKHIGLLANYSLHYVGGEAPGAVSADYYGFFADKVQALLGADRQDPPFVAMMSNGTSGDVNNINFRQAGPPRQPYEQMRIVADDVAAKAAEAVKSIQYQDWVQLNAKADTLQLGVRKPTADDVERAKKVVARSPHPVQTTVEGVYAKETIALTAYPDSVPVPVQAMRVGDLAVAQIPCEVFVQIGLELKAKSPIKPLFAVSLANGYNGYLPTPEHHKLGGYETWRARSSYLEPEASTKITAKLLELLTAMK